ncbi:MAG: hypothetical protein WD468_05550, partial [Pirellulales bacterium]
METVTMTNLNDLVSIAGEHCVSILMPTHSAGREGQQDAIRLKNLVAIAEKQLIERGMRSVSAREMLQPVLDLPHDLDVWRSRKQGLAVFRSVNEFVTYWLAAPLEEEVVVGRRFHIKQLLPVLDANPHFYLLAASRNQVRLLKTTWHGFETLQPFDLPTNIEAALNLQGADRGEQVHSGARGDYRKQSAVHHGQGGHRDTLKDEVAEYFQLIDKSLRPVLHEASWPLILAGVEYEMAIFREISGYKYIADEIVVGGVDYLNDQALYEKALPLARRFYDKAKLNAIKKYDGLAGTSQSSHEIEKIVPAAHAGQVDTLFVDYRAEEFGRFNPDTNWGEFTNQRDPS